MYRSSSTYLTRKQRLELSRRSLTLLLYILRTPFYERYSGHRISNVLQTLSAKVPLARLICQPLQRYIPEWQAMYFYMWSS
jgi:peroxin-16